MASLLSTYREAIHDKKTLHNTKYPAFQGYEGKSSSTSVTLSSQVEADLQMVFHGVGASRATVAQAVEHVPKAALHATMAGGARGAAMVPKVTPAAA